MILKLKSFFELHGFEVCSRFGDKLGLSTSKIRLFFIYLSFVTIGLAFPIYLIIAFLLKLKDNIRQKRSSVFDL